MRLLQEKAQESALSETNKTRFSIPWNREFWLMSRLRKAHGKEAILFLQKLSTHEQLFDSIFFYSNYPHVDNFPYAILLLLIHN